MTKKHYEAIAQALRSSKPEGSDDKSQAKLAQWYVTASAVIVSVAAFNPLFDMAKFQTAAGLE